MSNGTLEEPPVLVAVIVYVWDGVIVVGVPLITPVEVSKDKPLGKVGETDHESTAPEPYKVGDIGVMAEPVSKVSDAYEYENAGGTSFT